MSRVVSCYNYRSKMQASSALVSFVGSEIPQTSLVFRSLIRTLAIAEGTSARKILKQVWYFARLFVPLHIHTRKRRFITNNKILLNT